MEKTNHNKGLIIYQVADYLSAAGAWFLFFTYRKIIENPESDFKWSFVLNDLNLYLGLLIIPFCWIMFYYLFDHYQHVYRLSRVATFFRTLLLSIVGSLILLFTILTDDLSLRYETYVTSFVAIFTFHFLLTLFSRISILSFFKYRIHKGLIGFNTIVLGCGSKADHLIRELSSTKKKLGYRVLGFINTNKQSRIKTLGKINSLGSLDDLGEIIEQYHIDDLIIATEENERESIRGILNKVYPFHDQVLIKIIPGAHDILYGSVSMRNVRGVALIELQYHVMPRWEKLLKRIIDITGSTLLILLLFPFILFIAFQVANSSQGPVFFWQKRVGINGNIFRMVKFRSMYINAEVEGPQLSFDGDKRCTPWGAFMRKWRLDEIPQFINVLKGDMSLVGPRPERQHYINKILKIEPNYAHLLQVRPGITSLGQVKYGYASDVEQMLKRLKFDLIYLENMSIALDIKILFYTLIVLLQGKGK